jgi:hypothetical protein
VAAQNHALTLSETSAVKGSDGLGKCEGPHDHRAAFRGGERSALLRQGDEKGREGNRRSSAEQAREAFRPQGVSKRRERRHRDPAGKEP